MHKGLNQEEDMFHNMTFYSTPTISDRLLQ